MTGDDRPTYVYFPSFVGWPTRRAKELDVEAVVEEAERILEKWSDRVQLRGAYSTAVFQGQATALMWWIGHAVEDFQGLVIDFRQAEFSHAFHATRGFLGVTRPPETAPDHLPAFLRGEAPRKYLCVYPFVRTPEWYLLPKEERAALLREHGEIGREYPGVLPNTTSAFGLGDHEWILAFEADELTELVDCIRRLRDSRSRLYVKEETPFITGVRKDLVEVIRDVV
jgi:peroxiredoxin